MIDWEISNKKFGTNINDMNKKSKVWFKCDNCGREYVLSYKTILERKRCKRIKCKFCANKFLTDEQRKNRGYVKKCRAKYSKEKKKWLSNCYLRTWKEFVLRRSLTIEDRHDNCNVTKDFVFEMLGQQNYKCKLSGINLTHKKSLNDMSIDRIDNNYGHVKENIQLICRGLNIAKNRHTNDDILFFLDCLVNKIKFIPEKFSRDYLSSVRRNSYQRDVKRNFNNSLTTDDIIEMFEKQNGLCAISGLPMACYQHPCFSCSVDRINNDLFHTKDNIHLVLKCINRAKSKFSIIEVQTWLKDVKEQYGKLS